MPVGPALSLDTFVRPECNTPRHNPGMLENTHIARNHPLVPLALAEDVAVLLERALGKCGLLPQVWSKEAVGMGDGDEGSLQCVLESLGGTG
jgi:hypothetical protein